jgi:hypothetical protein
MTLGFALSAHAARREAVPMVVVLMTLVIGIGPGVAHAVVRLTIGDASGQPGAEVMLAVTLAADAGEAVAAAENDITFDPRVIAPSVNADGRPACEVNAAINKSGTRFGYRPVGCDPTRTTCTAVHAVVIAIDNVEPIASGALLYTCRFRIAAAAAPGLYTLSNLNVLYAPPPGGDFDAVGVAGHITVLPSLVPTPTATLEVLPTLTPTPPAATPTPTPTTAIPTPTPTQRMATPTPTRLISTATPTRHVATPTPTHATATPTTVPGDADCDGTLTLHDIEATLGVVFGTPAKCSADCNGDGAVTAADLGCLVLDISRHPNVSLETTR